MKQLLFTAFLLVCIVFSASSQENYLNQWPSFRGPFALGFVENSKTISQWDVETDKNVLWKTSIPGLGHSSPVIWNDKMFISTAISSSGDNEVKIGLYGDGDAVEDESIHEFKLYCLDKNSGEILWEKLATKNVPKVKRHTKASHADGTPATNGKYVVVFFGSNGLFCYNMDGDLVWKKDFDKMNAGPYNAPELEWGFSSSPIIHEDKLIIQCDYLGNCFLAAYDINTGKEIWQTPREEVSTWSSPTVFEKDGKTQIVVNGWKHMGGYDFETGAEIWKMSGGGDIPTPTPVIVDDLIFINNAHGRYSPIYAVKTDAKGDITLDKDETENESIVWSVKRGGAYMQTPLIYDGYLYNLQGNGSLSVFNATSGELMYKESLGSVGGFTASGVAADGKVYLCSEQGDVFVVKAGPEFQIIEHNKMNDVLMASPAINGNVLYFRTQKSVVAVGAK
ncbi:PQQ-binding-like beta-propeller repeat protein [Draconibacterium sp. IB214405]|uniref:outer membrane protein assembly factor BamB family protein n=1 Tax=Draconibacterium sp. IB214405 TaxID=3097352 RepID=UPI002A177F89|nr:PQQ-binding-like beta-propeller repeat protein [Draconibacterium sp. IB214405]MDX8340146.1 PQQ-binding-like beta-propeller repeat protein [Draconibacterium sp. IB214405]